jgi:hypothetical protein
VAPILLEVFEARFNGQKPSERRAQMPKSMPSMELDRALGRLRRDLQHLPRHEWDTYLLSLCNRFVSLADTPDRETGQRLRRGAGKNFPSFGQ